MLRDIEAMVFDVTFSVQKIYGSFILFETQEIRRWKIICTSQDPCSPKKPSSQPIN